jgi:DNA-binding MarR family transcriptional regulator
MMQASKTENSWTFLTNHAHVLLCLVEDSAMRMREIAEKTGITERAVQRIISDLADGGYIERKRDGRCNVYSVNTNKPLMHKIARHRTLQELLNLIMPAEAENQH